MKSGTCFPSLHQKQGECRQDLLFPDSSSCRAEQGQHSRLTGCLLTVGFGVWQARKMLHFQGKCWRSLAPPGPPKPAPSPQLGEFWGLVLYRGWEVFQGGISSPPPQASPQLSLKTEKFVLVFLLLLSSYEMSPATESLNKFRLLEQHLIQLLSSFHHNFKPLIY